MTYQCLPSVCDNILDTSSGAGSTYCHASAPSPFAYILSTWLSFSLWPLHLFGLMPWFDVDWKWVDTNFGLLPVLQPSSSHCNTQCHISFICFQKGKITFGNFVLPITMLPL